MGWHTSVVLIALCSTGKQLRHGGAHSLGGAPQVLSTFLQLHKTQKKKKNLYMEALHVAYTAAGYGQNDLFSRAHTDRHMCTSLSHTHTHSRRTKKKKKKEKQTQRWTCIHTQTQTHTDSPGSGLSCPSSAAILASWSSFFKVWTVLRAESISRGPQASWA